MSNNPLTFCIRVNDEVTLKDHLEYYALRTTGTHKYPRRTISKCCQDPEYVLPKISAMAFNGSTVVVTYTTVKIRFDKNGNLLGSFYYITVRNRMQMEEEFPIEFIAKNTFLRRDHRRILLHNKILICK